MIDRHPLLSAAWVSPPRQTPTAISPSTTDSAAAVSPVANRFVPDADPTALARAAASLKPTSDDFLLLLIAEQGCPDLTAVVDALKTVHPRFCGAVFPGVIHAGHRHATGAVVLRLPAHGAPRVVEHLPGGCAADDTADAWPEAGDAATAIVLIDGLAPHVSAFLESVYHRYGDRLNYWGGGAGLLQPAENPDPDAPPRPCLFSAAGPVSRGAIVAFTRLAASLGVQHGWAELTGPLIATRTDGNIIRELNWRPALEVYARHVAPHVGDEITARNLSDHSRAFPLGLRKQGNEFIVRDAIAAGPDGALVCVGDVPEHAALSILHGEREPLIKAAAQAASQALPPPDAIVHHCLLADCISRSLFLGDDFDRELAAVTASLASVSRDGEPTGMITLGEVSSRGDGYLEFFNMTCVAAVLHES